MVFSNFTRTESGFQILFKNETSIKYVKSLKYYKDDSTGIFSKKEFRWSFDRNYWASWETLNQGNISNLNARGNQNLFLEIRYIKSNSSANVTSFSVDYLQTTEVERGGCATSSSTTQYGGTIIPTQTTSTTVNATTLCGKSCDYYLWRPNQKGEQAIKTITGLEQILYNLSGAVQDADNVTGPGIGVYYNKVGEDIFFKRIDASTGIIMSESDGIITLSVDSSVGGYDASINELFGDLNDLSIYIDAELIKIDASISYNLNQVNQLDASIIRIDNDNLIQDASIDNKVDLTKTSEQVMIGVLKSLGFYSSLLIVSYAANVTLNMSLRDAFIVNTVNGDIEVTASNITDGKSFLLVMVMDSTGGYTIILDSTFEPLDDANSASNSADAVIMIFGFCWDSKVYYEIRNIT